MIYFQSIAVLSLTPQPLSHREWGGGEKPQNFRTFPPLLVGEGIRGEVVN